MNSNILKNYQVLIIGFVLFLFHLYFSLQMKQPIIFNDELGYIGLARYFISFDEFNIIGYYPLYAIVITPIYLFIHDLTLQYQAVLVLNSIIFILTYFSIIQLTNFIMLKYYGNNKGVILIAFFALTFPFLNTITNLHANENIYILLFIIYCLYILTNNLLSLTSHIIIVFLSFLFYLTHPIGLSVVLPTIIYSLIINYKNKQYVNIFILSVLFFVLFYISSEIYSFIQSFQGEKAHGLSYYLLNIDLFLKLLDKIFYTFIGQSSYLIFASSFMLIPAIMFIKKYFNRTLFLICIIIVINIAISILFMSLSERGGDHFIYGRYNERILPFILILGGIHIIKEQNTRQYIFMSILIFIILQFIYLQLVPKEFLMNGFNVSNIVSYLPFVRLTNNLFITTIVFSIILLVLVLLGVGKKNLFYIFIFLNITSSVYSNFEYYIKDSTKRVEESQIPMVIKKFFPNETQIAYLRINTFNAWAFANYKYYLNNKKVYKYDYDVNNLPNIIIGNCNNQLLKKDFNLIAFENHKNKCLYYKQGNKNIDRITIHTKHNFKLKNYKYTMSINRGGGGFLCIKIKNISNNPWPNRNGIGKIIGAVRLAIYKYDQSSKLLNKKTNRVDLKYTMYPNDVTTIKIPIEKNIKFIKLGLVQEGVHWFINQDGQKTKTIYIEEGIK